MPLKSHISSVAMAAALFCLPAAVSAQETHTITPSFPDHFKVKTVQVTNQSQETSGMGGEAVAQNTRTTMTTLGETDRVADGFHAKYYIDTFEVQALGPDGKPTTEDAMMNSIAQMMKDMGPAEVTLDRNLMPQRVDNIEDIKAKAKAALNASPEFKDNGVGDMLYNMMLANLTPETAADFLKQSKQAGDFFNKPLTIGQPVAMGGEPISFMGGTFKMNGTMTLVSWEEGKTAHLTYVMTPSAEDMRTFVGGIIKNLMNSMMPAMTQNSDPETMKMVQEMMDRMVQNMRITMAMSCNVDVSLVNYIDNHTECVTDTVMDLDLKTMMPDAMLKENPDAAKSLPTIHMVQKMHMTSDASLVQ